MSLERGVGRTELQAMAAKAPDSTRPGGPESDGAALAPEHPHGSRSEVFSQGASGPDRALPAEPAHHSPELPYPDGPLASRRADFKKPPRYIDPEALRQFHAIGHDCLTCGYYRCSAHHLIKRSQGGDDVQENLIPLCTACHVVLHDGGKVTVFGVTFTQQGVRNRIGQFLTSEAGEDHLDYVKTKLGVGAAAFLERYGVEEEA